MAGLAPLSPRAADILNSILQAYIRTGRPVPSGAVARMRKHNLSPASVRNVMAELVEAGYLSQPHTSAGRVPTLDAFRMFVQSLSASRFLDKELRDLRRQLCEVEGVAARVQCSSHILVQLTCGMGIAAAIPTVSQTLDQVELLALADARVLMIVVTRDKLVRNRVVSLDEPVTQDELNSVRNYINDNYRGCVLGEVRKGLRVRLEQASATYDAILRKLILLYDKGLLDVGLTPDVYTEGTSNLVSIDLRLTQEKLRELLHILEEKKLILQLLDRFLENSDGQVRVQVGLSEAHPSMEELSLIGMSVALPGGLNAKMAVIGPVRMDYRNAMSAVLHVSQVFQSLTV